MLLARRVVPDNPRRFRHLHNVRPLPLFRLHVLATGHHHRVLGHHVVVVRAQCHAPVRQLWAWAGLGAAAAAALALALASAAAGTAQGCRGSATGPEHASTAPSRATQVWGLAERRRGGGSGCGAGSAAVAGVVATVHLQGVALAEQDFAVLARVGDMGCIAAILSGAALTLARELVCVEGLDVGLHRGAGFVGRRCGYRAELGSK